jgi:hypothetical protein
MIWKRWRREKPYTVGNALSDLVSQGKNVQGLTAMALGTLGAGGVAIGVPTVPILTSILGAVGLVAAGVKTVDTVAKNAAPYTYNKHIGKIK